MKSKVLRSYSRLLLLVILLIIILVIYLLNNINNKHKNKGVIVTVNNFIISETHMYMKKYFKKINQVNTFFHHKNFEIDNSVIRMNLDTLYSLAIIDLQHGPVSIVLPQINDRYFSCYVLDEMHYEMLYTKKGGTYTFKPESDKGRYLVCLMRILVKQRTPEEILKVNQIQDSLSIKANKYPKKLELPEYNIKSYEYVKELVKKLFETEPKMSSRGMFGTKEEVDDLKHLMGVYLGWGGLKEKYVLYDSRFIENNDGKQEYQLHFGKVPTDAFWSVIVYDNNGFIYEKGNNSLNNFTTKPNKDGTYTINFSNDTNKINNLDIEHGWNYTIRMYEPQKTILDGTWSFPKETKV